MRRPYQFALLCGTSPDRAEVIRPGLVASLPRLAVGLALLGALGLLTAGQALAIPASPQALTVTQPDGTVVAARLMGDEHRHWRQTPDGTVLVRGADGYWVPGSKPLGRTRVRTAGAVRTAAQRALNTTGTGHIAVLMVNFSDTSTSYDKDDYETMLFGPGASMATFYTANSAGKYTVDSGPGGVAGWFDAAQTHDYYGANDAGGNDEHPAELVIEAVKAADAAGFDFSPYDQNGDGYVDSVAICHQGTDEAAAGGLETDIWSHSWDLNSAAAYGDGTGEVTTDDGVKVNAYIIQPEEQPNGDIATMGVYCHEYGHALGLPDLYDYGYDSAGLGAWTLMAGGSWGGGDGSSPAHFDAWCRTELDWVTPVVVTGNMLGTTITPAETTAYAVKLPAGSSTEYFLVENRQQSGFDASLPGAGLLIYHVDETQSSNDNQWYPGHEEAGNYRVALVQADGLWELEKNIDEGDAGDPYPGSTGATKFDATSTPPAQNYAGIGIPYVVRNIKQTGSNITADFVDVNAPGAPRSVTAIDTAGTADPSITVLWSKSVDDGRGQNDVVAYTIQRAEASTGPFAAVGEVTKGTTKYVDTAVQNAKDYWYIVAARDGSQSTAANAVGPVQSRDDVAPVAVTQLTAGDTPADQGNSITLSWNGYAAPADFSHYNVYRGTKSLTSTKSSDATKIATITGALNQAYVDLDVANGTPYWYAVTAVDATRDAVAPNGNELVAVTAVGPVEASPNFTFAFPPGNSIIAFGVDTGSRTLADLFGVPAAELKVARWDPAAAAYVKYWETPGSALLSPALGRAFWLSTTEAKSLDLSGQPAAEGDMAVGFASGWNMLGNPYTADMDVTGAMVTAGGQTLTLAQAAAKGYVRDYMWAYDAFAKSYKLVSPTVAWADKVIRKGRGVFFRAFTAGQLVMPRPVGAAVPTAVADPAAQVVNADWKLRLVAECAAGRDEDNFVGVSSQAAALNGIANAPLAGVDLALVGAEGVESAAHFTQPGASEAGCGVKVTTAAAGTVRVTWPDLSGIPNSVRPVLTDLTTGKRVYLRTATSYSFEATGAGAREFKLELDEAAGGALVIRGLSAAPAAKGAQVSYTLSADAAVTVEVLNAAGRPVRVLATGSYAAGGSPVTVAWDGCNAGGARVPAGRYLVRLTARTDDGQQASSVATLSVGR